MAVANYESSHGHTPPAYIPGPDGRPWHSWRVLILPYIEQDAIFKQYRFDEPWNGPNNSRLASEMPRILAFHGKHAPGLTTTNYLAIVGPDTMWPGHKSRRLSEVVQGAEGTILIAENHGLDVEWMEPRDLSMETMSFQFNDPNGLSSWYKHPAAVMMTGELRSFAEGYDEATLRAMVSVRPGSKLADPAVQPLPDGRLREKIGG